MSNATMTMHPRYQIQRVDMTIPMSEKLEIRVVEYTKADRIVKTELQYRMHTYDQNGSNMGITEWEQVERVRISMDGQ